MNLETSPDREEADEAVVYLQSVVDRLGALPALRRVVLLDRAGRVIARHGVQTRSELTRMATLAAALHATSARLSEMAGDPGRSVLRMETNRGVVILIPLARPSTHLILLVLEEGEGALPGEAEALLREIAWVDDAGWSVTDPLEFEASLTRSLGAFDDGPGPDEGRGPDANDSNETGSP